MIEQLYCEHCGCKIEYKGKGRKPIYCKDCAYSHKLWQQREWALYRNELERTQCKAIRNKDGTINFKKEAFEVKKLLKFYGLR